MVNDDHERPARTLAANLGESGSFHCPHNISIASRCPAIFAADELHFMSIVAKHLVELACVELHYKFHNDHLSETRINLPVTIVYRTVYFLSTGKIGEF